MIAVCHSSNWLMVIHWLIKSVAVCLTQKLWESTSLDIDKLNELNGKEEDLKWG